MSPTPPAASTSAPSTSGEGFWNVPNALSLFRLLLVGPICWALASHHPITALVVFLIAAVTDALDGYLARALNQVTAIGRQLDPLVDKIIVIAALICLVPLAAAGVPPWMVVLVVMRELLVQAVRSQIEGQGEPFGARAAGKCKMIAQCVAVSLALLTVAQAETPTRWLVFARDLALWAMLMLTLYSGAVYLGIAWPRLTGRVSAPQNRELAE